MSDDPFAQFDPDPNIPLKPAPLDPKLAHIREAAQTVYSCIRCGGTGRYRLRSGNYADCFSCKATGRKRESAEVQAKRRSGAQQAKETKEANRRQRVEDFIKENEEVVNFLRSAQEWSSFARSLHDAVVSYGRLSEKQLASAYAMMAKAAARQEQWEREREEKAKAQAAEAPVVDFSSITKLFAIAKANGLKRPVLRFGELRLSPAGETSTRPGAVFVKANGTYAGRVDDGKFYAVKGMEAVSQLILQLASDPANALMTKGRQLGYCCCCGRSLVDPISVKMGIGPICAEKWGVSREAFLAGEEVGDLDIEL